MSTGSAQGIGRAVAEHLLTEGAKVKTPKTYDFKTV